MKNMKLITETWKRFVNENEEPKSEGQEVVAKVHLSMEGFSSVLGFISPTASEEDKGNYEKLKIFVRREKKEIPANFDKFDLNEFYYSPDENFLKQIGYQLEKAMKNYSQALTLENIPKYGGLELVKGESSQDLPGGTSHQTPYFLKFKEGVFGNLFKEEYGKQYAASRPDKKYPLYTTEGRRKVFLQSLRDAINATIQLESFSGKYVFATEEIFKDFLKFDEIRDINNSITRLGPR